MLYFLIAADLHGCPDNLWFALKAHPETDCVLLAGDYGFPCELLPQICAGRPFYAIRGNNDPREFGFPDELILDLLPGEDNREALPARIRTFAPEEGETPVRGPDVLARFLITHGHYYILPEKESLFSGMSGVRFGRRRIDRTLADRAEAAKVDLAVYAHTHNYYADRKSASGLLLLNPGTLSGDPRAHPEVCSYVMVELSAEGLRPVRWQLPN